MRKTINQGLIQFGDMIPEILPQSLMKKYSLMPRKQAISGIHRPQDNREGQQARHRMVYEELFLFQLKMQAYRALNRNRMDGVVHTTDNTTIREFVPHGGIQELFCRNCSVVLVVQLLPMRN